MPCAGSPGGLAITVARLREVEITLQENPGVILGVQFQAQSRQEDGQAAPRRLRQEAAEEVWHGELQPARYSN